MLPGPTIIKKCSECTGLIKKHTIASGNIFGAIFWTDGKMDAPMPPDSPKLAKCPHCGSLIWIDTLETMDEVNAFEPRSSKAKEPLVLDMKDYVSCLESNKLLKPDVEKDLRMRAWWRGNDERRRGQHSALSEMEIQNLTALNKLLDESVDMERFMQAEIMRELGEFDESLELIKALSDEQLLPAASVIRNLAEQCDPTVAQIYAEEY